MTDHPDPYAQPDPPLPDVATLLRWSGEPLQGMPAINPPEPDPPSQDGGESRCRTGATDG